MATSRLLALLSSLLAKLPMARGLYGQAYITHHLIHQQKHTLLHLALSVQGPSLRLQPELNALAILPRQVQLLVVLAWRSQSLCRHPSNSMEWSRLSLWLMCRMTFEHAIHSTMAFAIDLAACSTCQQRLVSC